LLANQCLPKILGYQPRFRKSMFSAMLGGLY
jgi:hypothetical protein